MLKYILAIGVLCSCSLAETTQVVFLIGQSNASGRASSNDAGYASSPYDSNISYWYSTDKTGGGSIYYSGAITSLQTIPTFGPEMGLGRTLYQYGMNNLLIIKVTEGGTNLYYDWDPTPENPGVPNSSGNTEGYMYQRWVQQKNLALTALNNSYHVAGIFMDQGTADGGVSASYYNNLLSLVNAMKAELGDSTIPFVLSRVQDNGTASRTTIRTAQETVGNMPYNGWVNTDDLATIDGTHYDAPSQLLLGERMALEIIPEPYTKSELIIGLIALFCFNNIMMRRMR